MTIFYPDISSFQAGFPATGVPVICVKATEGTTYVNPDYARAIASAKSNGAVGFAYHFLRAGNAAEQANHCSGVIGKTPLMIDVESEVLLSGNVNPRSERARLSPPVPGALTVTSTPTVSDVVTFVKRFRNLGGVVELIYLPRWYWGNIGSPSLTPLKNLGLSLVSSDYTSYADSGPGWAAYGGMTPKIWQYSDNISKNGFSVDYNAYKGTVAEFAALIGGNVALTQDDIDKVAAATAKAVLKTDGIIPSPTGGTTNKFWTLASVASDTDVQVRKLQHMVQVLTNDLANQQATDTSVIIAGVLAGLSTQEQAAAIAAALGADLAADLIAALQSIQKQ